MGYKTEVFRKSNVSDDQYRPWEYFGEDPKGRKWYLQRATNDWFRYDGEGEGNPANWTNEFRDWKRIPDTRERK